MKQLTNEQLKKCIYVLTSLLVVVGFLASLFNLGVIEIPISSVELNKNIGNENAYERDIMAIQEVQPNFGDISSYFVTLSQKEGGAYAFEILKRAPLPSNTDLHLLGHIIGDEMFKQEGIEGMKYCTADFRNACSHTIVIGALLQDGLGVFDEVNEVCQRAPGGPGAYTMCFHGFGHGVLAYTGYDIPSAIELCSRVGTEKYGNNEFHQCVGGMVMEMHDGVHDPDAWLPQKEKFLDLDDPLKICQSDYMPDEAKYFCYVYITPYIFDAAGAQNGNPTPEIFSKAFSYCDDIKEEKYRLVCYGGLGKEFVVLAQSRDIRNVGQMKNEQLSQVVEWCELAAVEDGVRSCIFESQNSLYWGGENEYDVSIRFCSLMPNATREEVCFEHIFQNVAYYERNEAIKKEICEAVPNQYVEMCRAKLVI